MRPVITIALLGLLGLLAPAAMAVTVVNGETIPEGGAGIAARYPGDAGIEGDPTVIFAESFEKASDVRGLRGKPWTDISNKDGRCLRFDPEVPPGAAGRQSLEVTANRGHDSGGALYTSKLKGYDEVYARYYLKFAPDIGYTHHFVSLSGTVDPKPWPMGRAGMKPPGDNRFGSGLEPDAASGRHPPPGRWMFYTYWHEMRSWQGPNGTSFFGNCFRPARLELIPRGKWICVERMIRLNTVGKHDGAQAFWVDGVLQGWWGPGGVKGRWVKDNWSTRGGESFPGFNWRTVERLKINTFWVKLYISENVFKRTEQWAPKHPDLKINTKTAKVKFDNIVLATKYIGPIATRRKAPAKAAAKNGNGSVLVAPPRREPKLKADPEKEAALRGKLAAIIKAGAAKVKPTVYIDFAGRPARAKLLGADDSGVKVSMRGMEMPLPWRQVKPNRLYGIASKLTKDHKLLAEYCEAAGLAEDLEREKSLIE